MNISFEKKTLFIAMAGVILVSGSAVAGISGSKHDLSSAGGAQGSASTTTEVCVFCHTPHGANTDAEAPLWNKKIDTNVTYSRYSSLGTATLDGSEVSVGSVSLACLSCHDGTQAMDVMINTPGSGGYNSAGSELDAAGRAAMTGTPLPNLGTDLRNDHPISIEYAGGSCTGTTADCTPAATTGDADFNVAQYASINGNKQWWIDVSTFKVGGTAGSGNADTREKTDMILYTRTFTGGTEGPSVECASCHDPHNAATSGTGSVAFLRIDNSGSDVCLACHIK